MGVFLIKTYSTSILYINFNGDLCEKLIHIKMLKKNIKRINMLTQAWAMHSMWTAIRRVTKQSRVIGINLVCYYNMESTPDLGPPLLSAPGSL